MSAQPGYVYVGLVTRAIAFAIDATLINLVSIIVSLGVALALSILHLPKALNPVLIAIGGAAYILWALGYFVTCWSTTGQTPGGRAMGCRVVAVDGSIPKPRRAFIRCIGVVLAALPLFAGYVLILYDRQRRGFQDRIAQTLVVEDSSDPGDDADLALPQARLRAWGATPASAPERTGSPG